MRKVDVWMIGRSCRMLWLKTMHVVGENSMQHMVGDCVRMKSEVEFRGSPNLGRIEFEINEIS